jgi:adenine-specific DNA glycosylase
MTRHPLDILELRYTPDLWRTLVCCVALNKTRRVQAEPVLDELFSRWPTAYHMSLARQEDVSAVIRGLGLQNQRARGLVRMSSQYLELPADPSEGQVSDLHGVGEYALDAYRILFLGQTDFEPKDRVLLAYVRALNGEKLCA